MSYVDKLSESQANGSRRAGATMKGRKGRSPGESEKWAGERDGQLDALLRGFPSVSIIKCKMYRDAYWEAYQKAAATVEPSILARIA